MLKIDPNPTFTGEVKFSSPAGNHTLKLVFRHMTVEEHDAWWKAALERFMVHRDALAAHATAIQEHAAAVAKAQDEGTDVPAAPEAPKPEKTAVDEIMEVVAGWEEVDAEFSRDAMARLLSNYHDLTAKRICEAWSAALTQARREN